MKQPVRDRIESVPHVVNRLAVDTGMPFGEFRARYEEAVPAFDAERFARLVRDDAGWDDVVTATAENAPHGFIIYWSGDFGPLWRLAGDRWPCVEYLMGNHTIAQRMFRHNPAILLYAPLRTVIYENARGETWFAIDQPSTLFGGFGDPQIAEVGVELDRKVAVLLDHLGVPVPPALTSSGG